MALGVLLFVLSIVGYSYYFKKKFKLEIEFAIPFGIIVLIDIIYLFSLINCLKTVVIVLYVIGIILFIFYEILDKKNFGKCLKNQNLLFILVIMIFLGISISNLYMLHFDNFSHWAVIARQLISLNKLPNGNNILTSYYEYPLGSAYFIYYFNFFTSKSETCMLLGQMFMLVVFSLPFLNLVKKKRIINYVVYLVYLIFTLVIDNSIADLLVDSLLGISATVLYLYYYKYGNDLKKFFLISVFVNLFLLLIKNIGIFFYGINILFLIYLVLKNKHYLNIRDKILFVIEMFIPSVLFVLWRIRCKIVFNGVLGAQSVSLTNYKTNFLNKSRDDIIDIIRIFLKKWLVLITWLL